MSESTSVAAHRFNIGQFECVPDWSPTFDHDNQQSAATRQG